MRPQKQMNLWLAVHKVVELDAEPARLAQPEDD
jgi:hypothetical protein